MLEMRRYMAPKHAKMLQEFVDSGDQIAQVDWAGYKSAHIAKTILCKELAEMGIKNVNIISRRGDVFLVKEGSTK